MQSNRLRVLAIALSVFCLEGCATLASGPVFSEAKAPPPRAEKALVYVFRERAEPVAWGTTVYVDRAVVTSLRNKGFTWAYLDPGEYRIRTVWNLLSGQSNAAFQLTARAGETYYLEVKGISQVSGATVAGGTAVPTFTTGSGLILQDPKMAEERISACCRFEPPAASHYSPRP